ncbi:MAG: hypothetical protein MJ232_06885 [archaeon]|nr:hypothetical protein [archaeon]
MMSCYACKISIVNAFITKDGKNLIMECVVDDGQQKHVSTFWENPDNFQDVINEHIDKFNAECIKVNYQYRITRRL